MQSKIQYRICKCSDDGARVLLGSIFHKNPMCYGTKFNSLLFGIWYLYVNFGNIKKQCLSESSSNLLRVLKMQIFKEAYRKCWF